MYKATVKVFGMDGVSLVHLQTVELRAQFRIGCWPKTMASSLPHGSLHSQLITWQLTSQSQQVKEKDCSETRSTVMYNMIIYHLHMTV